MADNNNKIASIKKIIGASIVDSPPPTPNPGILPRKPRRLPNPIIASSQNKIPKPLPINVRIQRTDNNTGLFFGSDFSSAIVLMF